MNESARGAGSVQHIRWTGPNSLRHQSVLTDVPQRFDFEFDRCTVPILVVRRPAADHTLILSNGAVDLKRSQNQPIFQRSTWRSSIRHHQIYVCDPGTVGEQAIKLAWGQLAEDYWYIPEASKAIKSLCVLLGTPQPESRTYFGSSAGGFLSLAFLAYDARARAIVNNSQFDWTRWYPNDVKSLLSRTFSNQTALTVREKHPLRTDVLNLFKSLQIQPRINYWVNTLSHHDSTVSLPYMESFLVRNPQLSTYILINRYQDVASGHNPLSPEKTLNILNYANANYARF